MTLKEYQKAEEKFWSVFTPKNHRKFLCYVTDIVTGEQILPTYVIHTIERPTYRWNEGKKIWNDVTLECYEPLGCDILMKINTANVFDVRVVELTEVGDIAEEWQLNNCRFVHVDAPTLSWLGQTTDLNLSVLCRVNYQSIKVNTDIKGKD